MPTVEPPHPPQPEPHQLRQAAESFGVDPERYDRTRPPYPVAMVDRIVAASPGTDVLDVGCGTGIEARQFRAAGCTVLGVEPDPRMAEFARRGGIEVEVSTFEAWEPAGRTFDAVIAGTAWHWVDPVAGAEKAARVLRPGGRLAAFHHVFQLPAEVAEAFATVYRRAVPDSPFDVGAMRTPARTAFEAMYAKAADGIRAAGGFAEPEQWHYAWERHYSRDEWRDQMPTSGGWSSVPADARAEIVDAVVTAIDGLGGGFTMAYTTAVVTAARRF